MENKAKAFLNWSDEDFIGRWDNVPYPVKKGQQFMFEDWKADHFAKYLVDRELNKLGKSFTDPSRASLIKRCHPSFDLPEETSEMPLETQLLNQPSSKKPGRPKKVEKEEEFEGLK